MKRGPKVAVLGAGIMGSTTALMLARRGASVTLVDAAPHPFDGASRWNEGKIHLGHLYAADPSLRTARRLLPGGLAFKPLVEALIGTSLDVAVTTHDDTYLVHRDSVVGADAMGGYLDAVTSLVRGQPQADRYLVDVSGARVERLDAKQLDADYDTAHIAVGYRVPERSVDTQWLADRFVQALAAESSIEPLMRTRVVAVRRTGAAMDTPLLVDVDGGGTEGPFDFVVNALWQGRPAIDAGMAQPLPPVRSHRYRLSAFVQTRRPVSIPSTVVATGPFGDVKSYSPTSFYLSWYPSGLVAHGGGISPPAAPTLDETERRRILEEVLERLGRIIPAVRQLGNGASDLRLEGGWVYAVGEGSLADEKSELHRRDRIGIERSGSYLSVDTGKYSMAPWLALQVADAIVPLT